MQSRLMREIRESKVIWITQEHYQEFFPNNPPFRATLVSAGKLKPYADVHVVAAEGATDEEPCGGNGRTRDKVFVKLTYE